MSTRAEHARRTSEAVLHTARTLFSEQGYDATSLQQIADRMGVTKANVYYYFRTKEAILEALLHPFAEAHTALFDKVEAETDPNARRRLLCEGYVDQVVTAWRTVGHLNLGDPALRRQISITRTLDDLGARGINLLFGPTPSPDEIAGWHQMRDLAPALRALSDLPDAELRAVLVRLLTRAIPARSDG